MGAYAWLAFFISLFTVSMAWYFIVEPITTYCIQTANQSNFLPASSTFYNFLNVVITLLPVLAILLLAVGYVVESYVEERDNP